MLVAVLVGFGLFVGVSVCFLLLAALFVVFVCFGLWFRGRVWSALAGRLVCWVVGGFRFVGFCLWFCSCLLCWSLLVWLVFVGLFFVCCVCLLGLVLLDVSDPESHHCFIRSLGSLIFRLLLASSAYVRRAR